MGEKLKVLDLFSGIGGFALGLEAAGMETAAFCEVAAAPRALLAHHWPEVPCYDDIRTLNAARLAADGIGVDVICGGFPCQDISLAGEGAGLAGERSGLWREYARLIRELRPRFVIVENVAALLGRGLGVVLGDLASLGFDAWWDCIPASAVGAPHQRDRVWIVAYARSEQHEGYGDALRRAVATELSRPHSDSDGATQQRFARELPAPEGEISGRGGDRSGRLGEALPHAAGDGWFEDDFHVEGQARGRPPAGQPAGGDAPVNRVWSTEPDVGRVAHGVPARVDRLHGLGNAVVPQIPEILGRAILAAEARCARLAA